MATVADLEARLDELEARVEELESAPVSDAIPVEDVKTDG